MFHDIKKIGNVYFVLVALTFVVLDGFHSIDALAASTANVLNGQTMGTMYRVKVNAIKPIDTGQLKKEIDDHLELINQSMSPYLADSEISRFNALTQIDQRLRVSPDFWNVMLTAKRIYQLTDGTWDGTAAPLVNLWGFGPKKKAARVPSQKTIRALLPTIGFDLIDMEKGRWLGKKKQNVTLDLSSIAKGYAVDRVAQLLKEKGFENYLVDIGGEVFAAGHRLDGHPWRVGINRPQRQAPLDAVYQIVSLSGKALATSGDYRNYFKSGGRFYGHILDPRSGYPVNNGVVSVSILANTCVFADGLATGVMVMGVEKGLDLVEHLDQVECLIVTQGSDGRLRDHFSKGFIAERPH
ncbi:MAG: hypothetical protein CSB28_00010 [Desulfobacterales bacterium]|nr:MAG: hypothetical protein CSB28_00010 [Desulfobacterales bacterium]